MGEFVYSNGEKYVGNFVDGRPGGDGTEYFSDGEIKYSGGWKNGQPHGLGLYQFANKSLGLCYEGSFVGGLRDGTGTMHYDGKSKYIGMWAGGKRSGQGVMWYKAGRKYEGAWVGDLREGKGKLWGSDGELAWDGEWAADKKVDLR